VFFFSCCPIPVREYAATSTLLPRGQAFPNYTKPTFLAIFR